MSKPMILNGPLAAVAILIGAEGQTTFLKEDGSGALVSNDGVASAIGAAESRADNSSDPDPKFKNENIGIVKQGLVFANAANDSYNFGEDLELNADGQTIEKITSDPLVATAAETKTVDANNPGLKIYINFA